MQMEPSCQEYSGPHARRFDVCVRQLVMSLAAGYYGMGIKSLVTVQPMGPVGSSTVSFCPGPTTHISGRRVATRPNRLNLRGVNSPRLLIYLLMFKAIAH
ncbi:hypothetical protein RRG08_030156 [Elysia crispata]|uniref:Uncharacterized protein n=1 Tax=Elysia crispata TaxID=231223 RepID=A0AAE1DKH2_9GAST|nr:hypothetical protein RRG08_030156 [Elysia crispata]